MNKKKKLFLAAAVCAVLAIMTMAQKAFSMSPTYTTPIVNQTSLAYSTAPEVNLNTQRVDQLSMQAVVSSATVASVTFTDGTRSTDSITAVAGQFLTNQASTDAVTIAATSALAPVKATDKITVVTNTSAALLNQQIIFNGTALTFGVDIATGSSAAATAINIKNALAGFGSITASTAVGGVVCTTATTAGLVGNSYSLKSSTQAAVSVDSFLFTGGRSNALNNAVLTVNGSAYLNGYLWKSQDPNGIDNSSMTATSIANLLNNISGMKAQVSPSNSSVVVATATTPGTAGNSFTIVSSTPSVMTAASASFAGGRSTATVTIAGTVLTYGVDWTIGATSSGTVLSSTTAKGVSDAITANSTLNQIVRSTWTSGGLVITTAAVAGVSGNYPMSSGTGALTVATPLFTGGAASAINLATDQITITNHGLSTALAVLFSSAAGTVPTPLVGSTTYYPIVVDANTIKIATTSALAVAGTAVNLTSMTATGGGSFSLAPLAFTGSATGAWQLSNDDLNWINMSVATITVTSTTTANASTYWDFGQVNSHFIRFNFTGPTTGGVAIKVTPNGKSNP